MITIQIYFGRKINVDFENVTMASSMHPKNYKSGDKMNQH